MNKYVLLLPVCLLFSACNNKEQEEVDIDHMVMAEEDAKEWSSLPDNKLLTQEMQQGDLHAQESLLPEGAEAQPIQ